MDLVSPEEYSPEWSVSERRQASREKRRKARRLKDLGKCLLLLCFCFAVFKGSALLFGLLSGSGRAVLSESELASLDMPDWIRQDILPLNEFSRPGTPLDEMNGVVVHYTGNPGTTAEQNRSYYGNVAVTGETSVSSHFVIGMDGTIIQCVPLNEIAYCSNNRNNDTISIECCHPDESGAFTPETYAALVKLTRWLAENFNFKKKDIIRHYDITGKECPRYFVEHEEAWKDFVEEVFV